MLSGKNRVAAREALEAKVRDADIAWLRCTYEEMCKDRHCEVDPIVLEDEAQLREEWNCILKRTQYAPCLLM